VPSRWAGEFAQRFADLHNAKYGLCVANGTIALVAALQAAGIRFGDEVIVPAYTWDGTATAVLFAGGVPIFADVDPDTYCLSVESTRAAITPRTRAILPVHLAMRFADMDGLMQLARKHNLKVIEDCAHAHGGTYSGRGAGSIGDLGCFSFYPGKNLGACGEGGAVTTGNASYSRVIKMMRDWGQEQRYHHVLQGYNYRMEGIQGAVLRVKLRIGNQLSV
jgi:dTDP-4-amino-4,6-dideoxygalactose transaminase